MARDLRGYGPNPPFADWPGGARVAVTFVVNFEEGAELSIADGDERNEKVYEVADEVVGRPDPCLESHFDYGTRVAYWRIAELFDRYGVKFTLSSCGRAIERSPEITIDAAKRGHEIACHGWRWETHATMPLEQEREAIAKTVAVIERTTGMRPVGWHTRSAPSANTRKLLVEHGGFLYDSDAYGDELPYFVDVAGKRHLVLPYAFDTNDMHFHQGFQRFALGGDFATYTTDAFDWLHDEGAKTPRLLPIGLHLRMVGRPGRMAGLKRILDHVTRPGAKAWCATRADVARHWIARFGR
ncbi:MAG: polysaccharide deacetylase family protein [Alphaproteobacteria bacterium]|nr:polysaccharide deacetylase family protein [Alphaproteobacteria bacterium]